MGSWVKGSGFWVGRTWEGHRTSLEWRALASAPRGCRWGMFWFRVLGYLSDCALESAPLITGVFLCRLLSLSLSLSLTHSLSLLHTHTHSRSLCTRRWRRAQRHSSACICAARVSMGEVLLLRNTHFISHTLNVTHELCVSQNCGYEVTT